MGIAHHDATLATAQRLIYIISWKIEDDTRAKGAAQDNLNARFNLKSSVVIQGINVWWESHGTEMMSARAWLSNGTYSERRMLTVASNAFLAEQGSTFHDSYPGQAVLSLRRVSIPFLTYV